MSVLPTTVIDGLTYTIINGRPHYLPSLFNAAGVRRIASTYRVSIEKAAELYVRASDDCEACGGPPEPQPRLCIDHDHATGIVRGAVCGRCNTVLGTMRDDPTRLRKLADYLERPRA